MHKTKQRIFNDWNKNTEWKWNKWNNLNKAWIVEHPSWYKYFKINYHLKELPPEKMLFIDMQKSEINERKRMPNKTEIFMQFRTKISHVCLMLVIWIDVILCYFYGNVLSMKSKQKRMMARAPIESLRICSFCISSQFVPM